MSGINTKRAGGAQRRTARVEKESLEKRKMRNTAIIIASILAVLFVASLLINSKFLRRTLTAITIGDRPFTVVEFDYFYHSAYYEYSDLMYQQYPDYAESLLPSSDTPFTSQIYSYETGETWADVFTEYAINRMTALLHLYNAAATAGYVLPEEEYQAIEDEITELRRNAEYYGYRSIDRFLQGYYGSSINEQTYREISEFVYTANSYNNYKRGLLSYTDAELDAYYDENKDDLDIFEYRYFTVNPEEVAYDDYESYDEYLAAEAAAIEAAAADAAAIREGITNEEEFIAAARDYDPDAYADDDSTKSMYSGESLYEVMADWLRDEARAPGDIDVIDGDTASYVVYFISRDSNNYPITGMRQILVTRESVSSADFIGEDGELNEEAYDAMVEAADDEARGKAEAAYALFLEAGATEDALIALMEEHSEDTTEGGLYTTITKYPYQSEYAYAMKVVPEIEDWLFASGRKLGDYELVRTEAYGYHLLYSMGDGQLFSRFIADDRLRVRDHNAWHDTFGDFETVRHWAFTLTKR
jgi:hypothetical protein